MLPLGMDYGHTALLSAVGIFGKLSAICSAFSQTLHTCDISKEDVEPFDFSEDWLTHCFQG